jgi:hypothetical protein
MSQQMHYDESGRERQGTPIDTYDPGYQAGYRDPFAGAAGQKISYGNVSFQGGTDRGPTAGQRLALAIVSVVMLVPLAGIVFGITLGAASGNFLGLVAALIGMGLICLTIMVINYVFNHGH